MMFKKVISMMLALACVLSMASCSIFDKPKETEETSKESRTSGVKEEVFSTIDKIGDALANCDLEKFTENCVASSREMEKKMPVITDDDNVIDYKKSKTTQAWKLCNLIATSITYEIDEKSFKGGIWGSKCSVDVKFSYKDYKKVKEMKEQFMGPAEFNTLLRDVTETVDETYTLEFVKAEKGRHFVLANPDVLASVYNYDVGDVKFFKLFDMVKRSYLEGDGYDKTTDTYSNTNSFTIVFELDERAKDYTWTYIYALALETEPNWTYIYTSKTVIDKNPTEIRITYTQDNNFEDGFYAFFIYDQNNKQLVGQEFHVKNKPVDTVTGNTPDTSDATDTTETTDATTETT